MCVCDFQVTVEAGGTPATPLRQCASCLTPMSSSADSVSLGVAASIVAR